MLLLLSAVLLRIIIRILGSGKTVTAVKKDEFDRSFCICIPILRA
jgi:hypothetical protein